MDIELVGNKAKQEVIIPLEDNWVSSEFDTFQKAVDFAHPRGWSATNQKVQIRNVGNVFIVERYNPNDCGCGGGK